MQQLPWRKKFIYLIAKPLIKTLLYSLWGTCRVKKVIGEEHAKSALANGQPVIPCYWHQHHIFGIYYMKKKKKLGLKLGFLISPSRDGEIPAQIAKSWGAHPIRGSSTRTGARAIRDLYQIMTKDGISPVNTSDGPTGPIHKFKPGAVMLAQLTQSPILPVSYAASRYWELKSWDKFIIPKPFSRIVITIGEPRYVSKETGVNDQEPIRQEMENSLNKLRQDAEQALNQ